MRKQRWAARGRLDGNTVCLGYFKSEADAASAYNGFASEHYGEFARLNDVDNAYQAGRK
jgi:hypothetical protein